MYCGFQHLKTGLPKNQITISSLIRLKAVCTSVILVMHVCIAFYLSISIVFLTAYAFQKHSRPQQLILCQNLHAEVLQATISEGLAQGSYVVARAEFEPTTLRSKGIDSTNVPPCPMCHIIIGYCYNLLQKLM